MGNRITEELRVFVAVTSFVCLIQQVGLARIPGQTSQGNGRTIVMDISLLDVKADQAMILERVARDAAAVERLIAEGKARGIANVQMRSRSGERESVRIGQRVPVQTATLQGVPQIQYENTGLNVDADPEISGEQIQIKLKVDVTSIARNPALPGSPAFINRTLADTVRVRPGEVAVLLSAVQNEALWPDIAPSGGPGTRTAEQSHANFAVLVTARILD